MDNICCKAIDVVEKLSEQCESHGTIIELNRQRFEQICRVVLEYGITVLQSRN